MRKNIISIAVMAAALLAASCQNENIQEGVTPNQDAPQFTACIEGSGNTKTTVERVDGTSATYKTKWESTDNIKINSATYQATPYGTDSTRATFIYQSGETPSGTYKAYFPASMYVGTTATLPATYTYDNYTAGKYNMPMYAESSTTNLSFKNLCGILAITVSGTEMTKVKSITVISDKRMNGAFTSTSDGVLTFTSSAELTDADKKVTLSFSEAKAIESSVTFYIPVPVGTHNPLTINVSDGTLMKTMVTKKSGGVEISRNVVYPITFADNQPHILPGLFSVSASKQVQFTSGNLYYSSNDSKYHLESAQNVTYSTLGQSSYTASHVCHFFWVNTSDYTTSGLEPYASTYPTSGTPVHTQSTSDTFCFGEGNKANITVDGQSGLYALSKDEWNYLFSKRGTGDSKFKYGVTVNGVECCLVIAPDGYAGTIAASYDLTAWATAESSGLVCLPAAGYRNGSELSYAGSHGFYWSATSDGSKSRASYLDFKKTLVELSDGDRKYGYSVRLVSSVSK